MPTFKCTWCGNTNTDVYWKKKQPVSSVTFGRGGSTETWSDPSEANLAGSDVSSNTIAAGKIGLRDEVSLTLTELTLHSAIHVQFKLIFYGSWNNEKVKFLFDGSEVWTHQPGSANFGAGSNSGTGATVSMLLSHTSQAVSFKWTTGDGSLFLNHDYQNAGGGTPTSPLPNNLVNGQTTNGVNNADLRGAAADAAARAEESWGIHDLVIHLCDDSASSGANECSQHCSGHPSDANCGTAGNERVGMSTRWCHDCPSGNGAVCGSQVCD